MRIFRRTRIKETKPKRGLYGNRYNQSDISTWDNMSIIEKFCMIVMPCALGFMIYTILDMTEWIWWIRLPIAIGGVVGFIGLITLIVNYFHSEY